MILVFFILGIIILISSLLVILMLSTITIEIRNLEIENKKFKEDERIKGKYEVEISLNLLKSTKYFKITITPKKIRKILNSIKFKKIDFKKIENNKFIKSNIFFIIKKIKLKYLKLSINLGTEDAILTSYLVAIIASIIGIIIPYILDENEERCKYIVKPIYKNRNLYYIKLDSIIQIKIVHIIYSILILNKKEREKHDRTSNRRTYGYSYE